MMRRGFTLIELMLVVLIIGLVYGLAVNSMKRFDTEDDDVVDLLHVPDYVKSKQHRDHVSLICIDRCRECSLYVDGKAVKEIPPFIDEKAAFFRFDQRLLTREVTLQSLFRKDGVEEPVCFRYDLYPDGSSTEMIVKLKDMVIDYPGPFGEARRYDTIEELIDAKQELIQEVLE